MLINIGKIIKQLKLEKYLYWLHHSNGIIKITVKTLFDRLWTLVYFPELFPWRTFEVWWLGGQRKQACQFLVSRNLYSFLPHLIAFSIIFHFSGLFMFKWRGAEKKILRDRKSLEPYNIRMSKLYHGKLSIRMTECQNQKSEFLILC